MGLPLGLKERGFGGEGGRRSKKFSVSSKLEALFWAKKVIFYGVFFRTIFSKDFPSFFRRFLEQFLPDLDPKLSLESRKKCPFSVSRRLQDAVYNSARFLQDSMPFLNELFKVCLQRETPSIECRSASA